MKFKTTRAVALAVAAVALAPAGAQAATLYVEDDDGGSTCPVNEFYFGIQDAVDAAAPGDTIIVCPGQYEGPVSVHKENLTIRGPQAGVDPATRPLTGGAQEAVVTGFVGFDVSGAGTVVEGLTVLPTQPGLGVGVYVRGDDAQVRDTVITRFDQGVDVSFGAWAVRNRVTGQADSIAGIGASGDDARILDNRVTGSGGYGIVVNGGVDGTEVTGNALSGNATQPSTVTGASDAAECRDFSTGSGTAGTGSTWSANTGAKSSKPAGLCAVPAPAPALACPTLGPLSPLLGSPLRTIGRTVTLLDPTIRTLCGVR